MAVKSSEKPKKITRADLKIKAQELYDSLKSECLDVKQISTVGGYLYHIAKENKGAEKSSAPVLANKPILPLNATTKVPLDRVISKDDFAAESTKIK